MITDIQISKNFICFSSDEQFLLQHIQSLIMRHKTKSSQLSSPMPFFTSPFLPQLCVVKARVLTMIRGLGAKKAQGTMATNCSSSGRSGQRDWRQFVKKPWTDGLLRILIQILLAV